MEQSGSQFLGVVLNKVDMTVDKYGLSYGSYGSYGSTGKKSDQKKLIQEHIVVEKDSIKGDNAAPYTLTDFKRGLE